MATQPHGTRSAGCFFKNPPSSPIGTGKMIDDLGMKGTRRGGAVVSEKHANFIVTEGEEAKARTRWLWRKRFASESNENRELISNSKLSCGSVSKPGRGSDGIGRNFDKEAENP